MFWWRLESIGAPLCTAAGCVFNLWMKTEGRATQACVQRQQKWYATCLEFTEKHVMSHLFNLERCKTCYRWQAEVLTGTAIFSSKSWQGGDSGQFPFTVKCLISLSGYWWTTFVALLHGPNILAELWPVKWSSIWTLTGFEKPKLMFQHEQNFIADLDRFTISRSFIT